MTDQQVKSYHTKGNVEKLRPVHKGTALSKQTNKKDKQEQNALDKDVPFVQPPQKLGSCAYLHYHDFAYITVDAHVHKKGDRQVASQPLPLPPTS